LGCDPWQEPQCGLSTWRHSHVVLMSCLRQKHLWWWNDLLASYSDRISTSLLLLHDGSWKIKEY
jgi:hypothetical protein